VAKLVVSAEMVGLWRTVREIMAAGTAWTDEAEGGRHDEFMDASSRLHDLCGLGPHQLPPFFALNPTPPRWIDQDRQRRDFARAHKLGRMLDKAAEEAKTPGRPTRARMVAMVARPRE